MRKRIYISLPITGRDIEQVEASCIFAKAAIERHGFEAVSPLEASPDPDSSYEEHMGRDITALLGCDGVLFLDGHEASKGCMLEMQAALIYGKKVFKGFGELEREASGS